VYGRKSLVEILDTSVHKKMQKPIAKDVFLMYFDDLEVLVLELYSRYKIDLS